MFPFLYYSIIFDSVSHCIYRLYLFSKLTAIMKRKCLGLILSISASSQVNMSMLMQQMLAFDISAISQVNMSMLMQPILAFDIST